MLVVVAIGGLVIALAGSYALARSTGSKASATNGSSCDSARSNSALKLCLAGELKQEQMLMAKTVARAETYFPQTLLIAAQKSFQRYATAECLVAPSLNAGGSEYPLLVSRCEFKLTAGRIQQLGSDITDATQLRR